MASADVQAKLDEYSTDTRTFRVLVPELTVHKMVGELRDPVNGVLLGVQQGLGKTYFEDEVVSAQDISPLLLQAFDDPNHPSHNYVRSQLEDAEEADPSESTVARLGVPFDGYDEMSEDDVLAAMRHLPSVSISAIKDYEASHENRARIVAYNVGYGESYIDRQEGRVSSDLAETDSSKAAAQIRTREVVDDGVIEPGEGITGTGEGAVSDTAAADNSGDEPAKKKVVRRSRKSRATAEAEAEGGNEGEGEGGESS